MASEINPAVIVFAIFGWLSSREKVSGPFSWNHEAKQAADLARLFCDAQGWDYDTITFDEHIKTIKEKYPHE